MASQKTITKRALAVIGRQRDGLNGQDPMNSLQRRLPDVNRTQLNSALETLEAEGAICRVMDNGRVVRIQATRGRQTGAPRFADPTEKSAESKRQGRWAKGVPAYLTDDMCSPVVVRQGVPRGRKQTEAITTAATEQPTDRDADAASASMRGQKIPYHETLTTCLAALRSMADENGYGHELSVRGVLECIDGMTKSRAQRAMVHLHHMGVYTTHMQSFQKSSYQLNPAITTITEEMVRKCRDSWEKKPRVATAAEPELLANNKPSSSAPVEQQLADIVEAQEQKIAELSKTITALSDQNRELRSQVEQLKKQLPLPSQHDPRVAAILQRYRTS